MVVIYDVQMIAAVSVILDCAQFVSFNFLDTLYYRSPFTQQLLAYGVVWKHEAMEECFKLIKAKYSDFLQVDTMTKIIELKKDSDIIYDAFLISLPEKVLKGIATILAGICKN